MPGNDMRSQTPLIYRQFPTIENDEHDDEINGSWTRGYCLLEYVEGIEDERHSGGHDEDDYEDKYDVLHNRWRDGTFIMRINKEIYNVKMLAILLQVEEILGLDWYIL